VLLVVINLLSVASLVWTLRDAHLGELAGDIASMNWWWVGFAVVTDLCVYLTHASRWRTLLRPVARVRYWDAVQAIYVGLFANEVLPLRAGELVRCYMLSRPELPLSVSLTSALIERIFDGVWLCLCLFLVLRFVPLPGRLHYLVDGSYGLGIALLVVAGVLSFIMFHRHKVRTTEVSGKWQRQLRILIDDLEIIGHSKSLWASFAQSLPYLLLQTLPIFGAMRGYGFDLSLGAAFSLMVILRLGSVAPQAPGNIGFFQVLTHVVLEKIFNVDSAEAARFSLVLWGIVTFPLLIGGAAALFVTETKIGEIHEAAKNEASEMRRLSDKDTQRSEPTAFEK
jgi:glycosyltransferase 2 family protein